MENDSYTRTDTNRTDATDTTELNTLIATLIDSVDGYQKAAADTENSRFAEMFNARAQERQQALTGLQAAVARLGGNPEDDGTTAGAVHRGWINLKEAVLGRDECGLRTTARILDYLAQESARQCGPCMFGLPELARLFEELATGSREKALPARLRALAADVRRDAGLRRPSRAQR